MSQTYENTIDRICSEIENLKKEITEHLSIQHFNQVPLAAKSYALMHLELKFVLFGENKSLADEIHFLHSSYSENSQENTSRLSGHTPNPSQKEFLRHAREELIEDSGLAEDPAHGNFALEMQHLDEAGLAYPHTDHRLDHLLYHYYLERYKEFLLENESYSFDNSTSIRYPDYPAEAREIHQRMQALTTNLTERSENCGETELLPVIYEYAKSYRNELNALKAVVSASDPFYEGASFEFVKHTSELLWAALQTLENDLLLVPVQGLVTGKTLLELCDAAYDIIDSVEMDDSAKNIMMHYRKDFDEHIERLQPRKGCYIATMAYGNYNHPQVIRLRHFRDNHLANSAVGRSFVHFYYRVSPRMAEVGAKSPAVVKATRKLLDFMLRFF